MESIIMKCLQMALEGSLILLFVILLRLILKKAPKKYICILWAVALVRLCLPVLPEVPLPVSFSNITNVFHMNNENNISYDENRDVINTNKNTINVTTVHSNNIPVSNRDYTDNYIADNNLYKNQFENSNIMTDGSSEDKIINPKNAKTINVKMILGLLWIIGGAVALSILASKYICFRKYMKEARKAGNYKGCIIKKHDINGLPAVFGVLNPIIYVPYDFEEWGNENQRDMILLHEYTHIKRGDHIIRLFSMIILCVYWWNPLVWISVKLLHSDIEMACDEGVLFSMADDSKKEYASVILEYSVSKSGITLPVGFGESNTENRIKNVLGFKKVSIIFTAFLLILVGIAAVFIMTKPKDSASDETVVADAKIINDTSDDLVDPVENDQSTSIMASEPEVEDNSWLSQCKKYWTERLISEGVITDSKKSLYFCDNLDGLYEDEGIYDYYIIALKDNGDYNLYQSKLDESTNDMEFADTVHLDLNNINTREALLNSVDELGLLWTKSIMSLSRWYDIDNQHTDIINAVLNNLKSCDWEKYNSIINDKTLETKLEYFLHASGKVEKIFTGWESKIVKYTLADNDSVYIEFLSHGDDKYPVSVMDKKWQNDTASMEFDLEWLDDLDKEYDILSNLKLETLLNITERYDNINDHPQWYNFENKYIILDEIPEENVVLYGKYGGDSMVLRIDQHIIPVMLNWISPQLVMPNIYAGDYDDDGNIEYALKSHLRTGTGLSLDDLYIIDDLSEDNEYTLISLTDDYFYDQLDRIESNYNEQTSQLTLAVDDSELLFDISKEIESGNIYKAFSSAGYCRYDIVGDDIIYAAIAGPLFEEHTMVNADYYVDISSPVKYNKANGYVLGNIEMKYNTSGF